MPYKDKEKQANAARSHYLKNKEGMMKRAKEFTIKQRRTLRTIVAEWKNQGCQEEGCHENDPCCLQAHHEDPSKKDFNIGKAVQIGMSTEKLRKELLKCKCVCANCHFKLHDRMKRSGF